LGQKNKHKAAVTTLARNPIKDREKTHAPAVLKIPDQRGSEKEIGSTIIATEKRRDLITIAEGHLPGGQEGNIVSRGSKKKGLQDRDIGRLKINRN